MQFTDAGRLLGWLSASLLIVGLLLLSSLTIIMGAVVLVILLLEAGLFRRTIHIARHSITIVTEPRIVETIPKRWTQIKSLIKNSSRFAFRVGEINRTYRAGIRTEVESSQGIIPAGGKQEVSTLLACETPGKFESEGTTMSLIARRGLFKQKLNFQDGVAVISYPVSQARNTLSNVAAMSDLTSDPVRRGSGTDLAGLRPSSFLDDFHRIDWKATARTGKMMARDFYAEKEPTIMLLIDINIARLGRPASDQGSNLVLTQFANLFEDPYVTMSPMGMIVFDDRRIMSILDPEIGRESRRKLLRVLLEKFELTTDNAEELEDASRPYQELVDARQTLAMNVSAQGRATQFGDFLSSFAGKILPYYANAISEHLHRVRSRGEFKAFELVADLTEPALVICFTNRQTRLTSLVEGAKVAAGMNHQVIIALVEKVRDSGAANLPRGLIDSGIRIVITSPNELWKSINDELRAITQSRSIQTKSIMAAK